MTRCVLVLLGYLSILSSQTGRLPRLAFAVQRNERACVLVETKTDLKPLVRRDGFAVHAGLRFHLGHRVGRSQLGLGSARRLHSFS